MKYAMRILGLLVCLGMMTAAAVNCHKSLVGRELKEGAEETPDSVMSVQQGLVEINTTSLCDLKGFGGRVPLMITIDDQGVIKSVDLLPNAESKDFLVRTDGIRESFVGKRAEDAVGMKVDAVSGATMSSDAIKANVEAGLKYYLEKRDRLPSIGDDMPEDGGPGYKLWLALAVTLVGAIIPLLIRNKTVHIVILLLDVGVLGFWCGQFISYAQMVSYLASGAGIWTGLVPFVMMAVAFLYPIFGRKQHYCNHICPLGAIQQLAGYCTKKKVKMKPGLIKGLRLFREILWAVLSFFLWLPFVTEWMDYELFGAFVVRSASWIILVAAGAVVLISTVVPRPYCNYVCPTGTLMKTEELFDN